MPWQLTVNYNLQSGARLEYPRFIFNEESGELTFDIELRMSVPNGRRLITRVGAFTIRDGTSDRLARQDTPPAGANIDDNTVYFIRTTRTTATGYTDAVNAWRSGSTPATRRSALEAHLVAAGHIDPVSLAGS